MLSPGKNDLWFLPLGGTGEIGMNLNLYGHDGRWLMVDCGVSFNAPLHPVKTACTNEKERSENLHNIVAPDPRFIVEHKEALSGLVLTHAHEDHLGAVPYLWPRLRCPVYATAFTAEVLRRKLVQVGLDNKVPLIEVDADKLLQVGPFSVRWLAITHSIPDPFALHISTPAGNVLHTADWKIDAQPVAGQPFQHTLYQSLGDTPVLAMVGDSTNALKPGMSVSERSCFDGLLATIKPLTGRVVVSCFASNIARLISLARVAKKTNRYMALVGRSLVNMYSIAKSQGIWPEDLVLADVNHMGYLPPEEVLLVATGSQGEPRAALSRLALDSHPQLELSSGDHVVFSSIIIPGNEEAVHRLLQRFKAKGVDVVLSEQSPLPIHASGHPCAEELKLMYHWVKPDIAIPVHGENAHIQAHCAIAKESGVRKTYAGNNGDLYRLSPQAGIRRQLVKTGRISLQK
ncbi:ribonuclease J [Alteromonas sp. C1M14]|uniref:ribonuclease J n=1 Tax=Alteromonas sp. C1M14 TaxID=2841567 RepID=UPI001C08D9E5|nr:ribonuclease J [Alteromonas sp. C1M14]MBU2977156.1 ribonuclease J [Alteromonas sp. C1M14]